jgi:hypothetical protein
VFEDRVLKKESGAKSGEVIGDGGSCIKWSFMTCTPQQLLFGL